MSANSSKEVLGRVLKLITYFNRKEFAGAIFTQAFSLNWVISFRAHNSVVFMAAPALYKNNGVAYFWYGLLLTKLHDLHVLYSVYTLLATIHIDFRVVIYDPT